MTLGRLGVWYGLDRLDAAGVRDFARTVERLGYAALWYPEARGYEAMTLGGYLLGATEKLMIGSSIANIYARDAFTARRGTIGLNAMYGGRFMLGLGVSHKPMVEGVRGHTYDKPVPAMRAYLDTLQKDEAASSDFPVVLAALGPLMLKLAGARTQGAVPYNVTPRHTAEAKAILGPDKMLAVEQKICLETDPARARAIGRAELLRYMGMPNYRNNWLRIGFTEADLEGGGSDAFIDAMVLHGDVATVRRGIAAHFAAGATHVCLQPLHAEGDFTSRDAALKAMID